MNMTQALSDIRCKQKTIDDLLMSGDIKTTGENGTSRWELDILYQKEDCSMGFIYCDDLKAGKFPDHVHKKAKEYLIVVRGKIILNMHGENFRELVEGECASIPAGVVHHSVPLVPGTKIAYVCVPYDKDIGSILKDNLGE